MAKTPSDPAKPKKPANGMGWGGPPKGASTSKIPPGKRSRADLMTAQAKIPVEVRDARKAERARKRERMLMVLEKIAFATGKGTTDMNRIAAADKWLDRTEGKAVQPNANYDGGKKGLEELIAESQMLKEGS